MDDIENIIHIVSYYRRRPNLHSSAPLADIRQSILASQSPILGVAEGRQLHIKAATSDDKVLLVANAW